MSIDAGPGLFDAVGPEVVAFVARVNYEAQFPFDRPSAALRARIDAIHGEGPSGQQARWVPRRLIVQCYDLFDYYEFFLVDGRLVLNGANGSGKSTVLAVGVPVALDLDKAASRFDPFGGHGRHPSHYLLGEIPSTNGSMGYQYDDRTAHIAWEFQHEGTQEYLTIGIGLRARKVQAKTIDSWGFVIRDGRRVGPAHDFPLFDQEPDPAAPGEVRRLPFSKARLKTELLKGADTIPADRIALFTETASKYREWVNSLLFGFDRVQQYEFLMHTLVQLRTPKLTKDLKPETVSEELRNALPPLADQVVTEMTEIITSIQNAQGQLERTRAELGLVKEIDVAQRQYAIRVAQQAAHRASRDATVVAETEKRRTRLENAIATSRAAIDRATAELRDIETEMATVSMTIETLRSHDAASAVNDLKTSTADLRRATKAVVDGETARANHATYVARARGQETVVRDDWNRERKLVAQQLEALTDVLLTAHWAAAATAMTHAHAALDQLTIDRPSAPFGSVEMDSWARDATTRSRHVDALRHARRTVELASAALTAAAAALSQANEAVLAAQNEQRTRLATHQAAHAAAVASVREWARDEPTLRVPESVLLQVDERIEAFIVTGPTRPLLAPIVQHAAEPLARMEEEVAEWLRFRKELDGKRRAIVADLEERRKQKGVPPTPREGQLQARAALREAAIPVLPLYEAVDLLPGVDPVVVARLEAALAGAGLLDALLIAPDCVSLAKESLQPNTQWGDRWLSTDMPPVAGASLADWLIPVEGALPAAMVLSVLRGISVQPTDDTVPSATVYPRTIAGLDATWRSGDVAGRGSHAAEHAPQYLGEANRARRRKEAIAQLEEDLRVVDDDIATARDAWDEAVERRGQLVKALNALDGLAPVHALNTSASDLAAAARTLSLALAQVRTKDDVRASLARTLESANRDVVREGTPVPELISFDTETLQRVHGQTLQAGRDLQHVGRFREADDRLRHAVGTAQMETVQRLKEAELQAADLETARREESVAKSRVKTLTDLIESPDVKDMLSRLDALVERQRTLNVERDASKATVTKTTTLLQADSESLDDATRALDGEVDEADRSLVTLRAALEVYADQEMVEAQRALRAGGAVAAAKRLLRHRRETDPKRQESTLVDEVNADWGVLARVFNKHRAALDRYRPEQLDNKWTRFTNAENMPRRTNEMATDLEGTVHSIEQTVREQEHDLYIEFFLKRLGSQIAEHIRIARQMVKDMNATLSQRELTNREVLSLRWEPINAAASGGTDYRDIARLIDMDPELMTDRDREAVIRTFRGAVDGVRRQAKGGELAVSMKDAFHQVLDYRRWYAFRVFAQKPGLDKVEQDKKAFMKRSGGERSLVVVVPLLAAVDACYRGASPEAPRLVALDEAFQGVDAANTEVMYDVMNQMDFGFVMTSDKLWGESPHLRGCMTMNLHRDGDVILPTAFLWDGTERIDDTSPGIDDAS